MSGFEFIFSLFGLLLGLALAEGLGGLARALKSSHKVRIGWPTALLGLFVSCDVVTFWMYGWAVRDLIPVSWPTLFGGFKVAVSLAVIGAVIGEYVAAELLSENHRDSRGSSSLSVVDVSDSTDIDVRFGAVKSCHGAKNYR